jgi:hypothetical protein
MHYMHMTSASVANIMDTRPHYMNHYTINTSAAPIMYTTKVLGLNHTHKHLNIRQKNQLRVRFQT